MGTANSVRQRPHAMYQVMSQSYLGCHRSSGSLFQFSSLSRWKFGMRSRCAKSAQRQRLSPPHGFATLTVIVVLWCVQGLFDGGPADDSRPVPAAHLALKQALMSGDIQRAGQAIKQLLLESDLKAAGSGAGLPEDINRAASASVRGPVVLQVSWLGPAGEGSHAVPAFFHCCCAVDCNEGALRTTGHARAFELHLTIINKAIRTDFGLCTAASQSASGNIAAAHSVALRRRTVSTDHPDLYSFPAKPP